MCTQACIQNMHHDLTMHFTYIIVNVKNKSIIYKETIETFLFNTECCIKIYTALTMSSTATFQRHK